ncbi:MAG TPA: YciI family protein [Acidimicrobiales bacterium]|jgi:uncharacterized protein YciI|nr:YciI family protein [Acidimicrobiales bacterium]
MSHYLYKLIPPRPTFDQDMTDAEASVMGQHVAYWQDLTEKGTAIVFGPVADPAGAWGLAVVEAEAEHDVHALGVGDPAVASELARFEVCAMPGAVVARIGEAAPVPGAPAPGRELGTSSPPSPDVEVETP